MNTINRIKCFVFLMFTATMIGLAGCTSSVTIKPCCKFECKCTCCEDCGCQTGNCNCVPQNSCGCCGCCKGKCDVK